MEIPDELLERLALARHVAVLTGAGISAESGIKTFRDPDGLWAKLNPKELASIEGFMANPKLVWQWYQHRKEIVNSAMPNPGHYALAEMEKLFPQFTLITQNVDKLHHRAGSNKVLELHGNILDNHCQNCKQPYPGEIDISDDKLPSCSYCGGMVRPSVVWFGEMLPVHALNEAEKAAEECDVFFSIGTSAEVYPAANLPIQAKRSGAFVVEVNPNTTSLSFYVNVNIRAASGKALPILLKAYKQYLETRG